MVPVENLILDYYCKGVNFRRFPKDYILILGVKNGAGDRGRD